MRALAILLLVFLPSPAQSAPPPPECYGKPATIVGTPGRDVLVAENPYDVVVGLGGDDVIRSTLGKRGRLFACGGDGNDTIRGTDGFDDLDGEAGSDTIYGRGRSDGISGGDGHDLILGDSWDTEKDRARADRDDLAGGEGNDWLVGFRGVDEIDAGPGDDFVSGGPHWDLLVPGAGDDVVRGGWGQDYVFYQRSPAPISVDLAGGSITGEGDDEVTSLEFISGTAFDDHMSGSGRREILAGGGGSDVLAALGGDDLLLPDLVGSSTGGVIPHVGASVGDDVVDGGEGTDQVMYFGWEPQALTIDLTAGTAEGHGSDALRAIEDVSAGAYDPIEIVGTDGPNRLFTFSGTPDRIDARGGDDTIYVDGGHDEVDGGEGFDTCEHAEVERNCEATETSKAAARRVQTARLRLLWRAMPAPRAAAA